MKIKNQILQFTRNSSFEQIVVHIREGNVHADKQHSNSTRPNQRLFVILIGHHVYVVPYVIDIQRKEIFLKTIYPSRVYTKIYWEGENDVK